MRNILFLLLLIPSMIFGQGTSRSMDTLKVTYLKSLKAEAKIYVNDTLVLKDGTKQVTAFTDLLKSYLLTDHNVSHNHTNYSALNNVVSNGDGTRYLANDGTYKVVGGSGSIDSTLMKSNHQARLDTIKLHNQIITKEPIQSGTGFVKKSGITTSYDNSNYLTITGNGSGLTGITASQVGAQSVISNLSDTTKYVKKSNPVFLGVAKVGTDSVVTAINLRNGTYGHFAGSGGSSPSAIQTRDSLASLTGANRLDVGAVKRINQIITMPGTFKIPFNSLNTTIVPYALTGNTTFTEDTAGHISGATTLLQIYNSTGNTYTAYFGGNLYAVNGSSIDSFAVATNQVHTYLLGCMGYGTDAIYQYALQRVKTKVGAPIQLSAPGSFQATAASQTQINLSWSLPSPNGRNFQIYDSIVGVSSNFTNLLYSPLKTATSYNHTGLSNGQHVYYRIRTVGNGSDTLTSTYTTANTTTSALTTLGTPTINTPTVVSSTEIDLALAANISNNSGYDWTISRNGGSTFTTLAHTSTNTATYNFTTAHADSTYQFKARTTGDLVTYNHSAYSAVVSGVTSSNPTLSSISTNTTGDTITATFSKAMNTISSTSGISTSPSKTISSIVRGTNTTQYKIAITPAFANGDVITATLPNTWTSTDGGTYAGGSGISVTNNTTDAYINFDILSNARWSTDTIINTTSGIGQGIGATSITVGNRIQFQFNFTGNSGNMYLGLKSTHATGTYTDLKYCYLVGASMKCFYNGNATNPANFTPTTGDIMGIRLVTNGSNMDIVWEYYRSGSWTTIYTLTSQPQAAFYPFALFYNNGANTFILKPKIQ